MRLRGLFCLAALALVAAPPAFARAESEDIATAVLGFETQGVSPRIADEIGEDLRQNVANNHDLRLVPGKDLVELKLVFACADESRTCMALAGKSLNAEWLVYGSLKRASDNYVVWLKLFDVRKEKLAAWVTETLPRERASGPVLRASVARWFAKLRGRPADVGSLRVSSEVEGGIVSVDGVAVGATTGKPLLVSEVPSGTHVVSLSKPGQASASRSISIVSGEVLDTRLSLDHPESAAGSASFAGGATAADVTARRTDVVEDAAGRRGDSGPARAYRAAFWVTLGAGLVSAGAALKYGLDVSQVNQDLDPYRRYACGSAVCDSKNAPSGPLTTAQKTSATQLMDRGNRAHDLQWVCVGVGSALGLASGYLLYKGYLDADAPGHEVAQEGGHRRGLRIFPSAGASSGGVLAEFDF